MGKKKGFSRLFLLFAVVVMMGGCAGKSSTAHTPQDESGVSSTLAQEVLSDPVESTQDVREQDAPSSDSEPETVSESERKSLEDGMLFVTDPVFLLYNVFECKFPSDEGI